MYGRKLKMIHAGLIMIWLMPLSLQAETLELEAGNQQRYRLSEPVARVAVGNPDIADVAVINSRELLISPFTVGATSLTLWPKTGTDIKQLSLNVVVSVTDKQQTLTNLNKQQALQNPDKRQALQQLMDPPLTVMPAGNQVSLAGDIISLEQHDATKQALAMDEESGVDISQFAYPSQVQIDIKIVEISKSRLQSAGFFLGKGVNGGISRAIGSPGTITGINNDMSISGSKIPGTDAFNLIFGRQSNGLLATLSLLEGNGFAYTLAEPSLIAMSGQSANFLAGGEFPVPVRGGVDNSVSIEYKEFGVRLSLTPTVLDERRIALKVAPEVSELDFTAGIQSGGVTVPALRVRRTDTSVILGDGESFVISGLISQNTIANVDKLPGLGDIPILGAFFRSNRLNREDRELLMIVTPHLVQALAKDATLPALPGEHYRHYAPGFAEFFFMEDGQFGTDKPVPTSSGFSR